MKAVVACDPAPLAKVPIKGKQVTGKVKKTVCRSKQVADVKGKKPAKKVGKVVKFTKGSNYVEEDDKDEDEDLTKVSFDKYPLSYFILHMVYAYLNSNGLEVVSFNVVELVY
jgi:hypothetical protein